MNEVHEYALKNDVDQIDKRLAMLEQTSNEREKQISEVKTEVAINIERTKQVFEILNDIKNSIKEISVKINLLEAKPAQRWDDLVKTVIVVGVTAILTWAIKK